MIRGGRRSIALGMTACMAMGSAVLAMASSPAGASPPAVPDTAAAVAGSSWLVSNSRRRATSPRRRQGRPISPDGQRGARPRCHRIGAGQRAERVGLHGVAHRRLRDRRWCRRTGPTGAAAPRRGGARGEPAQLRRHGPREPPPRHRTGRRRRCWRIRHGAPVHGPVREYLHPGTRPRRPGRGRGTRDPPGGGLGQLARRPAVSDEQRTSAGGWTSPEQPTNTCTLDPANYGGPTRTRRPWQSRASLLKVH